LYSSGTAPKPGPNPSVLAAGRAAGAVLVPRRFRIIVCQIDPMSPSWLNCFPLLSPHAVGNPRNIQVDNFCRNVCELLFPALAPHESLPATIKNSGKSAVKSMTNTRHH
jgi:hypothetical protein